MSRFVFIRAVAGGVQPYRRYAAGTSFADTAANAVGNDLVLPFYTANPNNCMAPLDANGAAAMVAAAAANPGQGPWYTTVGAAAPAPSGADSVNA
jgi:hypothetical protein